MKYLCLAYGSEKDWNELTDAQQDEMLAQDEVIKARGGIMGPVETAVTTVTNWTGTPQIASGSYSALKLPLAGFSIIEAGSMEEVVQLVAGTPCARAKGAIEIRALLPD